MKVLDYLAEVGGAEAAEGEMNITALMLSATPILEGFGNANMPRNPDSSRFGKLYKIFFSKKDQSVTGCSVTPYMLEKSRVSAQQMNERNFHIFYRMLCNPVTDDPEDPEKKVVLFGGNQMGFSPEEKEKYHMLDPAGAFNEGEECRSDYNYLNGGHTQANTEYIRIYRDAPVGFQAIPAQPAYPEERAYKDAINMAATKWALANFFDEEQIDCIWRTTAGCLWLGNVNYKGDDDQPDVDESGRSGEALDNVADLWQIDRAKLIDACHCETIVLNKKPTKCPRALTQCLSLRDSMARTVYDRLFVWMIAQMSEKLTHFTGKMNEKADPFIGVLDIFGFEFYPDEQLLPDGGQVMNTLDQYNINMCNEVLQGEFVRCIFDLEQEIYQTQIHEIVDIDFDDNKDTIKLMKDNKVSIIKELDAQAASKKTGSAGDKGFHTGLERLIKTDKKKEGAGKRMNMTDGKGKREFAAGGPYGYDPKQKNVPKDLMTGHNAQTAGFFKLTHYAAEVTYDVRGWVDKNLDRLTTDSYEALLSTQMTHFMRPVFEPLAADMGASSVARQFAKSLDTLVMTLQSTDSNFVRCLKASNPLANNVWKNALVLGQLKYTGMLDTLVIRRGGFPARLEEQDFVDKYRVLAPEIADVKPVKSGAKALADHIEGLVPHIIQEMAEKPPEKQRNDGIRVGTPKVNKGPPLVLMRDWLARDLGEKVKKILSSSGVVAQAAVRMGMERHNYARMKSARDLQSSLRAVSLCKPFFATRDMTSRLIPEARLVLAHSTASKATELNHSHESRKSMKTFQEDNKDLVIAEAKERRQAKQEDDYARLVLEARQMEQIDELKANYIRKAQEAHSQARALFHETNDVVEAQASQIAAKDAEWSKISSNGVVRSVPLVRKYKASAQPFNPPASYKFSYKFTYKGTSEVAEE